MSFRITGPGSYRNRRGERVVIDRERNCSAWPWESNKGFRYNNDGQCSGFAIDRARDIVGVWEEPTFLQEVQERLKEASEHFKKEQPNYDLTRVSERFRALEDGWSLKAINSKDRNYTHVFSPNQHHTEFNCALICFGKDWDWSLVPQKRKVVTKLWVYEYYNEDGANTFHTFRSERKEPDGTHRTCLGAIEGSEITTEEEV